MDMHSWQAVLERSTATAFGDVEFKKKFQHMKTHEEYVSLVDSLEPFKTYLCSMKSLASIWKQKSSEKASLLRSKGNKFFGKKLFIEALQCYNEALSLAIQNDNEYALCLANRSAVFFHIKDFELCLLDIEEALKKKYEPSNRLVVRKIHCLFHLSRCEEAKLLCNTVLSQLKDLSDDSKCDDLKKELDQMINKLKVVSLTNIVEQTFSSKDPLEVAGQPSSTLKQASNHIGIRCTTDKGRFLVAEKSLKASDILIAEKPFASILLPTHYELRCYNCLNVLKSFFPCHSCTRVKYCSPQCQASSWESYHRFECSHMTILQDVGVAHLAFKIVVVAKLEKLLELRSNLNEDLFVPSVSSPLECNYEAVYHLVHNTHNILHQDLFQYAMTATLLLKCLDSNYFFESCDFKCSPEIRIFVGGLLMRHICQLVCNAHAITELHQDKLTNNSFVESEEQVRVASAIYPTSSMMNHSCSPNINLHFQGDVLIMRAASDLSAGDEIFNCYGPHHKHMSRRKRQEILRDQYAFTCSCTACSTEKETDFEHLAEAFRCNMCGGKVVDEEIDGALICCSKCKHVFDFSWLQGRRDLLIKSNAIFSEGLKMLKSESYAEAVKMFKACYQMRKKICHPCNKYLAEVIDVLAQCYALLGDFKTAEKYLMSSLEVVKEIFGEESLEYANDLRKFSEVCFHSGSLQKTRESAMKALKIFTTCYGDNHSAVQELNLILSNLNLH